MPTKRYEIIKKENDSVIETHYSAGKLAFASKHYSNDRYYVKETNLLNLEYKTYSLRKAYANWYC